MHKCFILHRRPPQPHGPRSGQPQRRRRSVRGRPLTPRRRPGQSPGAPTHPRGPRGRVLGRR